MPPRTNSPEFFGLQPDDASYQTFARDFPEGDPTAPAPYDFQERSVLETTPESVPSWVIPDSKYPNEADLEQALVIHATCQSIGALTPPDALDVIYFAASRGAAEAMAIMNPPNTDPHD